jgi:hypothetical protein
MWIPELESDEESTATKQSKWAFPFPFSPHPSSSSSTIVAVVVVGSLFCISFQQRNVTPTKQVWGFEPTTTCKEVTRDSQ